VWLHLFDFQRRLAQRVRQRQHVDFDVRNDVDPDVK